MRLFRVWVWATAALASLQAQTGDLTTLSLEEFMKVEVTSVSKGRQKLVRSPAAVFVITQDDIRRSGAGNLPEVLRLAPGVHVARLSGTAWAVGIRGFTDIYTNKLLVMIDGRTVYSSLFSGTLWSEHLVLLDDIEQIEIIRGPGATMWGANAVSGVISITTFRARQTPGGLVSASAGTLQPGRLGFRYGQESSDRLAWKASGQYSRLDYPPLEPGTAGPGALTSGRGSVRLEWQPRNRDTVTLDAEESHTRAPLIPVDALHPFAPARDLATRENTAFAMGKWTRETVRGDAMSAQAYVHREHIDGSNFRARLTSVDLDFQRTFRLSDRHALVGGGGARLNSVRTQGSAAFGFEPAGRNYYIYNAFVQDEWTLAPARLTLTGGVKFEHYTRAGTSTQPTARLMWTPTQRQGYWLALSQAVRIPSHADYANRTLVAVPGLPMVARFTGNEHATPERLNAFEAGARLQLNRRMAVDLTGFQHRYGRLPVYVVPPIESILKAIQANAPGVQAFLPLTAQNIRKAVNQGVEVSAQYELHQAMQLSGSYSSLFSRTTFPPGYSGSNTFGTPDNTPAHQGQLRAAWRFARGWSADPAVYLQGGVANRLRGFTRFDLHLARKLGESVQVEVSGQNLLRPYQQEFAGDLLYAPVLVPRSLEITVRWAF
jgi:iron complex outermembrane receptor protein